MKKWIIGIDEVGRGPLAGPVYVCAVAMHFDDYKKMKWYREGFLLTDSKKMTSVARVLWEVEASKLSKIKKTKMAIASRSAGVIDKKGISKCINECVRSVLRQLALDSKQCKVFLDGGLKAPAEYKDQQTVISGDTVHKIISLASVVAKVRRDELMTKLHKKFPKYRWLENKGYGTAVHLKVLKDKGPSPLHRKSFISKVI